MQTEHAQYKIVKPNYVLCVWMVASVLHDLSNYGTHIDGSTLTSKVTKGSTITHPPQYQKAYFCVDSDSD